jgi:hypothetical protein
MVGRRLPVYARAWLEDPAVKVWRGRLGAGTFSGYYSFLHPYLRGIGRSPGEAVVWAKDPVNEDAVLDSIGAFVTPIQRRHATKMLANASLRSFYMHNRVRLPRDMTLIVRGVQPPVERQLTIPQIRELVGLAVQPWRSMILMKWGALADNQGLIDISNRHAETLVRALQEKAEICKLTMPGRKQHRNEQPFYTYAHPEALVSLRDYFDRERGWPKTHEAVWVYGTEVRHGQPVTTRGFEEAWRRLLRRAKLIPAATTDDPGQRYGYGVHNTRDLAISELCTVPGFNIMVADFMAGHEVDPLKYKEFWKTKPQYVDEQYRLAIPHLSILTGQAPSTGMSEDEMVQRLARSPRFTELVLKLVKEGGSRDSTVEGNK